MHNKGEFQVNSSSKCTIILLCHILIFYMLIYHPAHEIVFLTTMFKIQAKIIMLLSLSVWNIILQAMRADVRFQEGNPWLVAQKHRFITRFFAAAQAADAGRYWRGRSYC